MVEITSDSLYGLIFLLGFFIGITVRDVIAHNS